MKITSIKLGPKYQDKQRMMTALAGRCFSAKEALLACNSGLLDQTSPTALSALDAKVKSGASLLFQEAFAGMVFVVSATNDPIRQALFPQMSFSEAIAKGTAFLQLMAVKEALNGLSAEEIAGMAAATTLDLVFRPNLPRVTETCGMGGDRGWETKEVKTINASTLSALVLASMGIPTFKHGSYGNTTRVGSTDVPVNFGARICISEPREILDLFAETGFWFSDAHSVKTIHYLSHLLMMETVNHILGPMTVPVARSTRLFKVVGVNHHVNPETMAMAYAILHRKGFLNLGGVVVVAGLDEIPQRKHPTAKWVRDHTFLDEVSPRATLVSLAREGSFLGTFVLTDENFGAPPLQEERLKIPNTLEGLMRANEAALQGTDPVLSPYLARNASLGLLAMSLSKENPDLLAELPHYYEDCLKIIGTGRALEKLKKYVKASGGSFKDWL